MLFLVPDQDGPPSAPPSSDFNVELDLDDAPFLDEPEPEPEAPPPPEEKPDPVAMPPKEARPSLKERIRALLPLLLANKKRLLLAGGSLVVILVVAVVVNLFLFGDPKPVAEEKTSAPEQPAPQAEPTRIVVPSTPTEEGAPPPPAFIVEWEPFWVPLKNSEGEIRFLVFQFSIPTDDPTLNAELHARTVILRDAVYYFLKNKEFTPLLDKESTDTLREDIVSVINEHVVTGKVTTLLFSNYYLTDS